jgi:hypothetical protein
MTLGGNDLLGLVFAGGRLVLDGLQVGGAAGSSEALAVQVFLGLDGLAFGTRKLVSRKKISG